MNSNIVHPDFQQRRPAAGSVPATGNEHFPPGSERAVPEQQPSAAALAMKSRPRKLWMSGLSWSHDLLICAAMRGLGYPMEPLPVPDKAALRLGKEFGNRGQCNPTYYTVGNLIKHLQQLEAGGLSRQRIIQEHAFVTAGACGPCRFGMYITEYRKALKDAGFDGFRVVLLQQEAGLQQIHGEQAVIEFSPRFFRTLLKAVLAGDVLNLMAYRLRPYELEAGATDSALARCRTLLSDALQQGRSLPGALRRCRHILAAVAVNRLQPKPLVSIIGEFWAMTTEGEGNYHLQRFLEGQGAEVAIQPLSNWLLYLLWEQIQDTRRRLELRAQDGGVRGLQGTQPRKKLLLLKAARFLFRAWFRRYAAAIGLQRYHLPDLDEMARIADPYYDKELRGGESFMEVGKLIDSVEARRAHLVVSVKPFGCMPSSSVSDGVQSLVTARYPEALFCAIETSGDGEVNAHSRIQMMLFKAHQVAREEYQDALRRLGISEQEAGQRLARRRRQSSALYQPQRRCAGHAANLILELER